MNGAELWLKRKMLGLTPSELGELLNINPRTITRWEVRQGDIPDDLAAHVDDLVEDHNDLVTAIWSRFFSDDFGDEPVGLPLFNRQQDVPAWTPAGTTPEDWNNAVVAVYREALEAADIHVEWNRFLEADAS